MPRIPLVIDESSRTGQQLTEAAANATDGMVFDNFQQNILLVVDNGHTAPINVTIITPQLIDDDLAVEERVVNVVNGTKVVIGPFSNITYGNDSGQVEVDVDIDTNVKISAVQVGLIN